MLSYKVCFARFPVTDWGEELELGFARVKSAALAKNLASCEEIVLFAATAGLAADRLCARYASLSPAKALLFDAIGTERVEALCDAFCDEMKAEAEKRGGFTRPRFSAGYGDLPLSLQREIFRALSPEKHIGAYLRESLIASPSKTVTAIIGVGKK
jgi:cobalamin-dependent methionine synthase I